MPALGGKPKLITENVYSGVGLSPDSKKMAFIRYLGNSSTLNIAEMDGTNERAFFPRGSEEKALWGVMALSAAFCEEFIYRGYLQIGVQRFSGRVGVAIVLQALAYEFAHAALPWRIMVTVTFLGVFFGAFAAWRRSLVPGMVIDLLAVFAHK